MMPIITTTSITMRTTNYTNNTNSFKGVHDGGVDLDHAQQVRPALGAPDDGPRRPNKLIIVIISTIRVIY